MSKWEDDRWKEDYTEQAKELDIPLPKPKRSFREKHKLPAFTDTYGYLTAFEKSVIAVGISAVVIPLAIVGGIAQWSWHDAVVWGEFDGRATISTPYGYVYSFNDLLDDVDEGTLIPMKLRERITRTPKPWKKHNTENFGHGSTPMRIDWPLFMKEMQ